MTRAYISDMLDSLRNTGNSNITAVDSGADEGTNECRWCFGVQRSSYPPSTTKSKKADCRLPRFSRRVDRDSRPDSMSSCRLDSKQAHCTCMRWRLAEREVRGSAVALQAATFKGRHFDQLADSEFLKIIELLYFICTLNLTLTITVTLSNIDSV